MTARVNYTVTPNLSIQLYAQPFVSAGDYTRFVALVDGRARQLETAPVMLAILAMNYSR